MSNAIQGDNLKLGKFVVIEDGCEIGRNVTIEDFVVVKIGTRIGDNCYIHAGAKIGMPAFTLKVENNRRIRIEQKGVTVLEDSVDVGCNTIIQRGVERNTVIGAKTYINNLCNIGHDVHIGSNCTIGLSVEISGHTEMGDNVYISPGVTILNRVKMGGNVFVGIGSLVLHDIPSDTKVVGRPAMEISRYKRDRKRLNEILGVDGDSLPISTKKGKWWRRLNAVRKKIWSRLFGLMLY